MENYKKIKCNKCKRHKFVKEEDVPSDEYSFFCKKCAKEIEEERKNICRHCGKEFKHEDEYNEICNSCYGFIMNDYKPTGPMRKVFEVIPSCDGCLSWKDIANMRWDIYKILKKIK